MSGRSLIHLSFPLGLLLLEISSWLLLARERELLVFYP